MYPSWSRCDLRWFVILWVKTNVLFLCLGCTIIPLGGGGSKDAIRRMFTWRTYLTSQLSLYSLPLSGGMPSVLFLFVRFSFRFLTARAMWYKMLSAQETLFLPSYWQPLSRCFLIICPRENDYWSRCHCFLFPNKFLGYSFVQCCG